MMVSDSNQGLLTYSSTKSFTTSISCEGWALDLLRNQRLVARIPMSLTVVVRMFTDVR